MITKKSKKTVLLPGALGDWTKYRPQIEEAAKNRPASKSPNRLSERELLDMNLAFLGIFEEYAKALQRSSGLPLSAVSCSVETDNYAEILKTVNIPVVQFRVSAPGKEPVFLCFDMQLANALINACVGGQPDSSPSKNLTEIEENILEVCSSGGAEKLLSGNAENAEVKYLNSPNLYFDQTVDESEALVLAKARLNFGKLSGEIFLISGLSNIGKHTPRNKSGAASADLSRIPPAITSRINMPVRSVLGNTLISAKELYELEAGDVIVLDSSINDLLHVSIGEDLNILGQPGIKDDRLCVQILKEGSGRIERIKLKDPKSSMQEMSSSLDSGIDEEPGPGLQEEQEFPKEEV